MSTDDTYNQAKFRYLLENCLVNGLTSNPRGEETKELQDFQFEIRAGYPFMGFKSRKYNVEYFKKEMLWKLGANKYDDSIKDHAAMWSSVQNPDKTFNSNYGQYWFGEQRGFWHVVEELIRDRESRKAVIPMLNASHLSPQTVDTVCTTAIGFRIRSYTLVMSVQMRSSDQIFGLGTDLPTFAFLYRLVYRMLLSTYPDLFTGSINVTAMSSHIYQRHYGMVKDILFESKNDYSIIEMPYPSSAEEVLFLISSRGRYTSAKAEFKLANWLLPTKL